MSDDARFTVHLKHGGAIPAENVWKGQDGEFWHLLPVHSDHSIIRKYRSRAIENIEVNAP